MALKTGNNTVYLSIVNGKLARRVKQKTENSVTRVMKDQSTVEEEYYRSIEGTLIGLDIKNHEEYGESLLVYLKDDKTYCVQMSMNSRYATNFLKTLPNVDLEKAVEITPSEKIVDGKPDSTIFINQGGKALKRHYTKENPNGIPEPTLKFGKRGAADTWDFEAVTEFLYDNVIVPFRDTLKEKAKAKGDDLPF
jgi:hypothetical protein